MEMQNIGKRGNVCRLAIALLLTAITVILPHHNDRTMIDDHHLNLMSFQFYLTAVLRECEAKTNLSSIRADRTCVRVSAQNSDAFSKNVLLFLHANSSV